jgi:signal transduction histidine kinase/CheY-like chemotaxis protein
MSREAVLIVRHETFHFANRSFEELCDYANAELLEGPSLLLPPTEHAAFFQLVQQHLLSQVALPDALVECLHRTSGPFLARVAFHPFRPHESTSDEPPLCVCVFSDPLFYKPLFESTSSMILLLELCPSNDDLVLLKSNHAGERLLLNSSANSPAANERRPRLLQQELGFCFDDDDRLYFTRQRSVGTPYLKQFRINRRDDVSADIYLASSITYLGKSLKGRSLFTLTADDKTEVSRLKLEVQDGKRYLQAQNTFFAKMVHELRTPLSGMLGMSAMLRNTLLNSDQSDMINTLHACGDSLLTLIGNILDLSNLERNNVVLREQPFDLLDCVEDTLDIAAASASQKDIELMYQVVTKLPTKVVIGDCMRLRQIILNLVSNAVKFTHNRGHVTVSVGLASPSAPSSLLSSDQVEVQFSVKDNGIGIAEKAAPRIFDAYVQSDSSIQQRFGGTGLGLSVVKSLVSLMGGTVRVESQEGHGSTFSFGVLLRQSAVFQPQHLISSSHFSGKTSLIQLRDHVLACNLQQKLMDLGFGAVSIIAEHGPKPGEHFDVQFSDEYFRAAASGVVVMIVGMNGLNTAGEQHFYLRKPIRRKQLFEMLCEAMNLPLPSPPTPPPEARPKMPRSGSPPTRGRILLVDDNIVGRKVTHRLLHTMGYSDAAVSTASDGALAVEAVKFQMPDVVLMDLEMPVMDGLEATRRIRQLLPAKLQLRKPYIIALTAHATEEHKVKCLEAGMNAFLMKPVSFDALYQALEAVNSRK